MPLLVFLAARCVGILLCAGCCSPCLTAIYVRTHTKLPRCVLHTLDHHHTPKHCLCRGGASNPRAHPSLGHDVSWQQFRIRMTPLVVWSGWHHLFATVDRVIFDFSMRQNVSQMPCPTNCHPLGRMQWKGAVFSNDRLIGSNDSNRLYCIANHFLVSLSLTHSLM